jgi:dihydrofolate reductase
MGTLTSYMYVTLDGFVADRDGGLEWAPVDRDEMAVANAYFAAHEGIVFGRTVYRMFVEYWDTMDRDDPAVDPHDAEFAGIFAGMTRIVVSSSLEEVDPKAVLIRDDVPRTIADLKGRTAGDLLLICGPRLRTTLTRAGLVDRHRLLVAPVALGDGVRLYDELEEPLGLRLVDHRTFRSGVVMLDLEP